MTISAPVPALSPTRMHERDDLAVRRLAEAAAARLSSEPVLGTTAEPAVLDAAVGATVTSGGLGLDGALRVWTDELAPACIAIEHPRYLAFIPSAPTRLAAGFDMVVSATNPYGGSWYEGAGVVFAENQALRWIADLAGMPEGAGGVFVQGGTIGNLSALVAAREHARSSRAVAPARWAVCVTEETHSSVSHSLRTVMDVDVVVVPGDERGRMTGAALRATVEALPADRRDGIFAVVATAGSTNLGVVDDLAGIGEVARANGWWLHVDGAYGGAGLAAPSVRELYTGIEHADSFIVDPHKWLFGPFDCCALVYRDPAIARAAHTQHAAYLDAVTMEGEWNPSDYAIQLTRRARGLPLWFSLAAHGTDAYRDAVEQTLRVAREGAELIRRAEHLELLVEPELSVLVFARRGWDDADYGPWGDRLLEQGLAFVTSTRHRGRTCARLAIVNPLTTPADLAAILDTLR